jgi:predicted S18 family serine protease
MAMQYAKTLKLAVLSVTTAAAAAFFLTLVTVPFATPNAEATAALAKGKPCTTCHGKGTPSKANVKKSKKKKKKSDIIWPGDHDSLAQLSSFEDQIAHAHVHR